MNEELLWERVHTIISEGVDCGEHEDEIFRKVKKEVRPVLLYYRDKYEHIKKEGKE